MAACSCSRAIRFRAVCSIHTLLHLHAIRLGFFCARFLLCDLLSLPTGYSEFTRAKVYQELALVRYRGGGLGAVCSRAKTPRFNVHGSVPKEGQAWVHLTTGYRVLIHLHGWARDGHLALLPFDQQHACIYRVMQPSGLIPIVWQRALHYNFGASRCSLSKNWAGVQTGRGEKS